MLDTNYILFLYINAIKQGYFPQENSENFCNARFMPAKPIHYLICDKPWISSSDEVGGHLGVQ